MYYTDLRGDKYHEGYQYLEEGHITVSIDVRKLTGVGITKVTGGISCHAAYCLGKRDQNMPFKRYAEVLPEIGHGQGLEMAEMTHLNYTYSDFYDICKEADRVIIFKCVDWDENYIKAVSHYVKSFKDALYDAAFTLGIKSLYCSELIYQADLKAGGKLQCSIEDLAGLGRPYISPDGLLVAKNVIVVWDSKGEFTGMTGPQVREIIFNKAA